MKSYSKITTEVFNKKHKTKLFCSFFDNSFEGFWHFNSDLSENFPIEKDITFFQGVDKQSVTDS